MEIALNSSISRSQSMIVKMNRCQLSSQCFLQQLSNKWWLFVKYFLLIVGVSENKRIIVTLQPTLTNAIPEPEEERENEQDSPPTLIPGDPQLTTLVESLNHEQKVRFNEIQNSIIHFRRYSSSSCVRKGSA